MTIYQRDEFISNLQKQLGKTNLDEPPVRSYSMQPQLKVMQDYSQDELVEVLKKQCENIHTTIEHIYKKDLFDVLEKYNQGEAVYSNDERFRELGVFDHLTESDWVWDLNQGHENIEKAERADVGIVVNDLTLAESATCVLYVDENKPRSVSLLPKNFVAIVPKSSIVPRLTQATSQIRQMAEVPSCVSFVSGPSNSADIELSLVVGVHGPVKATYIIVEDY